MKMKELKEKLSNEGYEFSERMIQYYIQIGILPAADYPHANQAVYSNIHLNRLMRIGQMKKNGMSINDIKEYVQKENEEIRQKALKRNISYEMMCELGEIYKKEEADYILAEIKNKKYCLSKNEMIEKLSCDKLIFDLAIDTGALDNKIEYNENDLLILLCVRNLIQSNGADGKSANIIEKISDISKINNLAMQLIHLYENDIDSMWIYEYLLQSIVQRKLSEHSAKKDKLTEKYE